MSGKPNTPPPPSQPGPTHPPGKPGLDEPSPWMSVNQAAEYAGIHPKTVLTALRRYRTSRWQKGMRGSQPNGPNSCWRIHRADVDRWLAGEPPLQPSRRLRSAS